MVLKILQKTHVFMLSLKKLRIKKKKLLQLYAFRNLTEVPLSYFVGKLSLEEANAKLKENK